MERLRLNPLDRDAIWNLDLPTSRSARLRLYANCEPDGDCLVWKSTNPQIRRDDWSRVSPWKLAHELRAGRRIPRNVTVQRTCGNPRCVLHTAVMKRGTFASEKARQRNVDAVVKRNRRRRKRRKPSARSDGPRSPAV